MARKKKACPYCGKDHPVWWNKAKYRDGWYLTFPDPAKANGQRQICLARGWDGHDDAIRQWHLSEADVKVPGPDANGQLDGESMRVGELVNLLLDHLESTLSAKRFRLTKSYLTDFARNFGNDSVAQMRVGGIARVQKWIRRHSGWRSPSTIRGVVSRVKQVFNHAVEQNYISSSPIKGLRRPKDVVRVNVFSEEQVDAILAESEHEFAMAFKFLLLTGCRPEEACSADLTSVRNNGNRNDLHLMVNHKNFRHTGEQRRIYLLFSEAKKIVEGAVEAYDQGAALLRTKSGVPWTDATLNKAFRAATASERCVKLGLDQHTVETTTNGVKVRRYEYVPYTCRHTFAFRLLTGFYKDRKGRPIKKNYGEVAIYLGNSAKMVEEVYGKLAKATEMLGEEIA